MSRLIDEVAAIIRRVGTDQVMSRFKTLAATDIDEKSANDFVTLADRECERELTERLGEIIDIPIIGEEATAADPALLTRHASVDAAWVVDPVDGTSNFIDGSPDFAVMVALIEGGQTTASWIWQPVAESMLTAERGRGARINGSALNRSTTERILRGMRKTKYLPEPARTILRATHLDDFEIIAGRKCAGVEYTSLMIGEFDFLFYWRTLPWDHAPGTLLAEEVGLRVGRLDGSTYRPLDSPQGLLVGPPESWDEIAAPIQAALGSIISPDETPYPADGSTDRSAGDRR